MGIAITIIVTAVSTFILTLVGIVLFLNNIDLSDDSEGERK